MKRDSSKFQVPSANITLIYHREYQSYNNMKGRCLNPKIEEWKHYGGRGITICERWLAGFRYFLKDMGPKPTKKHTLERIDNSKGYSPDNCKWATRKEQAQNTRRNRLLTFNGDTKCMQEWADELGLNYITIHSRLSKGWTIEEALSTSRKEGHRSRSKIITFQGKTATLPEWSEIIGIHTDTLYYRLKHGWTVENTLTIPPGEGEYIQKNERRNLKKITFQGKTLSISKWAKETGLSNSTIEGRLANNWSIENTLTTPLIKKKRYLTYQNRTMSMAEWSRELGISSDTIKDRLRWGWSIEKALTTPIRKHKPHKKSNQH